jgi:hypothetical protein
MVICLLMSKLPTYGRVADFVVPMCQRAGCDQLGALMCPLCDDENAPNPFVACSQGVLISLLLSFFTCSLYYAWLNAL